MSLYDQFESSPKEERRNLKRICIPALLAVAAFAVVLLAGCGGGSRSPQAVVEEATLKGIESGKLEASLRIKSEGKRGGDMRVELGGPFQGGGKGSLPQLAMTAEAHGTANGKKVDFEGGVTALSDRAFIDFRGNTYEVDPTTFGFLRSSFERAAQEEGKKTGDVTACQEAAAGLQLSEFVESPESEGAVDVAGTSTTKVSGELSAKGAADAVIQLAEDPACKAQIELAGPLPMAELEKARGELSRAVKRAHVEVYVGDDHIIRKVVAEVTIEPPQAANERVELEFEATLSGVNEEQKIEAPSGAKPLADLFRELGVDPLELFEGGAAGGIGGLIEGLTGAGGGTGGGTGAGGGTGGGGAGGGSSAGGAGGEGSSSGGGGESGSGGGSGGASDRGYLECLQEARTLTDLQKCANLSR